MSRNVWGLIVAVVLGTMVVGVPVAAADEAGDSYRATALYFLPAVDGWASEVGEAVEVARIKPEQVCGAEMTALAYRGRGLAEDLRGTVPAPEIADAHLAWAGEVEELTAIAETACGDAEGASYALRFEAQRMSRIQSQVWAWLLGTVNPAVEPGGIAVTLE